MCWRAVKKLLTHSLDQWSCFWHTCNSLGVAAMHLAKLEAKISWHLFFRTWCMWLAQVCCLIVEWSLIETATSRLQARLMPGCTTLLIRCFVSINMRLDTRFYPLSLVMCRRFSSQLHVVMCRYSEFQPLLFHQHSKLEPAPIEFELFDKVSSTPVRNLNDFLLSHWSQRISRLLFEELRYAETEIIIICRYIVHLLRDKHRHIPVVSKNNYQKLLHIKSYRQIVYRGWVVVVVVVVVVAAAAAAAAAVLVLVVLLLMVKRQEGYPHHLHVNHLSTGPLSASSR